MVTIEAGAARRAVASPEEINLPDKKHVREYARTGCTGKRDE